MKTQRVHKIRLYPNNKQNDYFVQACDVSRFAYNWGLAEWKRQYECGERSNFYGLQKKFNEVKYKEFSWVLEVSKCVCSRPFVNLGNAFKSFFRENKAGKRSRFPKYKKKGGYASFYVSSDRIQFKDKKVKLPRLGWVRIAEVLRFEGKLMSAVVSKTADKWFISVHIEQETRIGKKVGSVIGVDVGIKNLAVVSDGRVFENPKALSKHQKRLRMLHKDLSRKKKGSNNRKKAISKLQRQHYKISCIRNDFLHKATTAITKGVSTIVVEDLNIQGMVKNRKLSKALSDASLGELVRQIEYKAHWKGVRIVKADRFYPSSKTCSECGCIKDDLSLNDRTYKCEYCGFEIDRDLNAAINLKNLAVGSTVTAYCLESSGSSFEKDETIDWVGISHKDGLCQTL